MRCARGRALRLRPLATSIAERHIRAARYARLLRPLAQSHHAVQALARHHHGYQEEHEVPRIDPCADELREHAEERRHGERPDIGERHLHARELERELLPEPCRRSVDRRGVDGSASAAHEHKPREERRVARHEHAYERNRDERLTEPDHIAVKYYKDYHSGAAKTLKSIQITLAARLEKFNLESLSGLTAVDELDLPSLGEKKVALFALIPDNDTSFNFLVSILYTQLFQQLFYLADHKYGGSLPVHCHFIMEEFANVSLPNDFSKILSVMRSRAISVSIILQNLAQLKTLFEKEWESIMGNCDTFLYLGGNEQSTHKYVSELLGKETIDLNTYGKSSGRSGNYSTNYQISGRELMTPDEVRMMDNRYALLFIRGERPIKDLKYDILKHPNLSRTVDGGADPYVHGKTDIAIADIALCRPDEVMGEMIDWKEGDYILLSETEVEELYDEEGKSQ